MKKNTRVKSNLTNSSGGYHRTTASWAANADIDHLPNRDSYYE